MGAVANISGQYTYRCWLLIIRRSAALRSLPYQLRRVQPEAKTGHSAGQQREPVIDDPVAEHGKDRRCPRRAEAGRDRHQRDRAGLHAPAAERFGARRWCRMTASSMPYPATCPAAWTSRRRPAARIAAIDPGNRLCLPGPGDRQNYVAAGDSCATGLSWCRAQQDRRPPPHVGCGRDHRHRDRGGCRRGPARQAHLLTAHCRAAVPGRWPAIVRGR